MTERVIGQRRQADDRVIADQLGGLGVPDVARSARADALRCMAEVTPLVETEVQPLNLVPGCAQERDQDGADVATITRNENPHRQPPDLGEEFGYAWWHHHPATIGSAALAPDTCGSGLFVTRYSITFRLNSPPVRRDHGFASNRSITAYVRIRIRGP